MRFHTVFSEQLIITVCFLLGNYPKGSIQHTEHGESLKSRTDHKFHLLLNPDVYRPKIRIRQVSPKLQ